MAHLNINIANLRSNELVRAPKQFRTAATPGGSTPNPIATPIRYAKLAQIVDGELRCFEFDLPTSTPGGVLQGNNLNTIEGFALVGLPFPDAPVNFCGPPAAQVGNTLEILDGPDAGSYQIVSFEASLPCFVLNLDQPLTATNTNIGWRIQVSDQPPDPTAPVVTNYAEVIKARAVPGSPLHRYRPYLGPGDHTGTDLVTTGPSPLFTHAGSAGQHTAVSRDFTVDAADNPLFLGDAEADPPIPPVSVGDVLEVLSGPEQGSYVITAVVSDSVVTVSHTFANTSTGLDWQIVVADPDAEGSTTVTSAGALFIGDESNPVVPGMYIEIAAGPDEGRHQIASVTDDTTLELIAPLTADATGLSYRIDIVSDHATTLQIVPVSGGQLIAVPDQDSIEVKIARPIRDQLDAATFDTFREGGSQAIDMFNELGAYLACHRLKLAASHSQGVPVDDRVIIAALPWRGHLVNGVLFFDAQDPAQEKYDLSDPAEPVWPIRWLRNRWRLELAIGREPLQEPTEAEACPDE